MGGKLEPSLSPMKVFDRVMLPGVELIGNVRDPGPKRLIAWPTRTTELPQDLSAELTKSSSNGPDTESDASADPRQCMNVLFLAHRDIADGRVRGRTVPEMMRRRAPHRDSERLLCQTCSAVVV
jgi:hypothetical protein